MSLLYNRLKDLEHENRSKKSALSELDNLPLDHEIKRQLAEKTLRAKQGLVGGAILFAISLIVLAGIWSSWGSHLVKKTRDRLISFSPPPATSPVKKPPAAATKIVPAATITAKKQSKPKTTVPVIVNAARTKTTPKKKTTVVKAKTIAPDYFKEGTAFFKQNKWQEAIVAYRKDLQQHPKNSQTYNNIGVAYFRSGNSKRAVANLRKALKLNPYYTEAHFNIAAALELTGNRKKALFHYMRFLELAPPAKYQALRKKVKKYISYN